MKSAIVFTDSGPILILTCYDSLNEPRLIEKLAEKRITKYVAFELSVDLVHQKYGTQFNIVCDDLNETDELRVLDYEGGRVMEMFDFADFGPPIFHQAPVRQTV